jgi:rod shape-determining protein MreB
MMSPNAVLNVGIDLGTSRSSVSSPGQRFVVDSYVGWPVDMVARKLVKKPVMIGREAFDHRTMLDLQRPLERGVIKEGSDKTQSAVKEILSHLLTLAGAGPGNREGRKVRAVVGVPAEASRQNKQHLRTVMKDMVDSLLIVSEPFAVAYGMEALLHALVIDIGAGTADFCVMNGRYPTEEQQRTLAQAGDWVDEQLERLINERYPDASISRHMVRDWKEAHSFVGEPPAPVVVSAPVKGKATSLDITKEMRSACEGLLAPVADTMIDMISKVEPEFQERLRNNVILSGGSALTRGFDKKLEQYLGEFGGGKVTVVPDPIFVGSDGGLAIAVDAPDSEWDRLTN